MKYVCIEVSCSWKMYELQKPTICDLLTVKSLLQGGVLKMTK